MPRLETFSVRIKTGEAGPRTIPRYSINGFNIDFDELSGACGPGEVLEATAHPQSFPHSLILIGPEEGEWDIEGMTITYECDGSEPYTVKLGAVHLDDASDLNIWHERPPKVIDV